MWISLRISETLQQHDVKPFLHKKFNYCQVKGLTEIKPFYKLQESRLIDRPVEWCQSVIILRRWRLFSNAVYIRPTLEWSYATIEGMWKCLKHLLYPTLLPRYQKLYA